MHRLTERIRKYSEFVESGQLVSGDCREVRILSISSDSPVDVLYSLADKILVIEDEMAITPQENLLRKYATLTT